MIWGKLWETFVIVTSFFRKIVVILLQAFSYINLFNSISITRQIFTISHSTRTPCCPTTYRSLCDHRLLWHHFCLRCDISKSIQLCSPIVKELIIIKRKSLTAQKHNWNLLGIHKVLYILSQCSFWSTVCETVRPVLSDRCLSCLSVCLSVLYVTLVIMVKRFDGSRQNLAYR